jgi:cytochrome c-type biogenesis protein CcmH/NrfG
MQGLADSWKQSCFLIPVAKNIQNWQTASASLACSQQCDGEQPALCQQTANILLASSQRLNGDQPSQKSLEALDHLIKCVGYFSTSKTT